MMSDSVFVGMVVAGLLLAVGGWLLSNAGPRTRHESCGVGGLMIVFGCVLMLIPFLSVLLGLVLHQSGWLS